jgi:hypothetical protein
MAAVPWIGLDGFREPNEVSRPFAGKALISSLTLLYGLLLVAPHRWTPHGSGYVLKLIGLMIFGGWMIWVSTSATLGYLSGKKHWAVIPVVVIAAVAAIGGPLTLVWRSREARVGSTEDWTPN